MLRFISLSLTALSVTRSRVLLTDVRIVQSAPTTPKHDLSIPKQGKRELTTTGSLPDAFIMNNALHQNQVEQTRAQPRLMAQPEIEIDSPSAVKIQLKQYEIELSDIVRDSVRNQLAPGEKLGLAEYDRLKRGIRPIFQRIKGDKILRQNGNQNFYAQRRYLRKFLLDELSRRGVDRATSEQWVSVRCRGAY